ncbi:MAG: LOG family protein [Meiothermus sp.]|uniref:LOG family protein n=1 Tax=Meiothermus sp. TaxID=1955249 RepID=UPI0025ED321D|nr:LOG family protein [Meiothermus sp.]MCS7068420.1 LOG family protein [Meiothermus sp.]MDW8425227.1 LOG family protein [Meiothermus sp.]
MRLVTVFGSSRVQPGTPAFAEAHAWGRAIGQAGFGVATGGYNGAMEAVSQGVKEAGGLVVGITAPVLFPHRDGPNVHVDLELPSSSLLTRIERLIDVGVACLALPGGVGTLAEILAAWNLNHIAQMHGKPQKPLGVHVGWLEVVRAGLEVTPETLAMLTPIDSPQSLEAFLSALANAPAPAK